MSVFSREQTDYIASRFYDYFDRKRNGRRLSIRDAATLVSYVAGPASEPEECIVSDPSRIRVKGGGRVRPSDTQVQEIVAQSAQGDAWDDVFDELIKSLDKRLSVVATAAFDKRLPVEKICRRLGVANNTYYALRLDVLSKAGVIAVAKGLIKI